VQDWRKKTEQHSAGRPAVGRATASFRLANRCRRVPDRRPEVIAKRVDLFVPSPAEEPLSLQLPQRFIGPIVAGFSVGVPCPRQSLTVPNYGATTAEPPREFAVPPSMRRPERSNRGRRHERTAPFRQYKLDKHYSHFVTPGRRGSARVSRVHRSRDKKTVAGPCSTLGAKLDDGCRQSWARTAAPATAIGAVSARRTRDNSEYRRWVCSGRLSR